MKKLLSLTLALAALGGILALEPADFTDLVRFHEYEAQMERPTRSLGEACVFVDKPDNYDALASSTEMYQIIRYESPLPTDTQANLNAIYSMIENELGVHEVMPPWDDVIATLLHSPEANVDDPIVQQAVVAAVEMLSSPDFRAGFSTLVTQQEAELDMRRATGVVEYGAGVAVAAGVAAVCGAVGGAAYAAGTAYEEGSGVVETAVNVVSGAVQGAAEAVYNVIDGLTGGWLSRD